MGISPNLGVFEIPRASSRQSKKDLSFDERSQVAGPQKPGFEGAPQGSHDDQANALANLSSDELDAVTAYLSETVAMVKESEDES